jgi:hypothetical protein
MMKIYSIIFFILVVSVAGFGQEKPKSVTSLVGNFWVSVETSPAEQNDVVTQTHWEQGITLWHSGRNFITPYVSTDFVVDTRGKDWNNKALANAGVKVRHIFSRGLIEAAIGLAGEKRFKSGNLSAQPTASVAYWAGWQSPQTAEHSVRYFNGYPGSSWGVVGNISPAERRNVIGLFSLTQGVNLIDAGKWQTVPFVKVQSGFDTKGYDWNNKVLTSAGIKIVVPRRSATIEAGIAYTDEHRQGLHSGGVAAFVTLWSGWSRTLKRD